MVMLFDQQRASTCTCSECGGGQAVAAATNNNDIPVCHSGCSQQRFSGEFAARAHDAATGMRARTAKPEIADGGTVTGEPPDGALE